PPATPEPRHGCSPAGNPDAQSAPTHSRSDSANSDSNPPETAPPRCSSSPRPARRRPRPHARHPHHRRRGLTTRLRRRLDRLRRRNQPQNIPLTRGIPTVAISDVARGFLVSSAGLTGFQLEPTAFGREGS